MRKSNFALRLQPSLLEEARTLALAEVTWDRRLARAATELGVEVVVPTA